MQNLLEFSHAPLAHGVSEDQLIASMLRFEAEALVPRAPFSFHALLRSEAGDRYAHLVVATDPAAFERIVEEAPNLPAFQALGRCLDIPTMDLKHHRPLMPFEVPLRFAALEVGTFAPRDRNSFSTEALTRHGNAVREGYLRGRPEHIAQTLTDIGDGQFAELVFGDSLAHVKQTCHGYASNPITQPLLSLCDPQSVSITYWIPLLLRDLDAHRACEHTTRDA